MQELAVERLRTPVERHPEGGIGSTAAILHAVREYPFPSASDVEQLEGALTAGRLSVKASDFLSD